MVKQGEFYRRDQKEGETINDFVAKLREIAADCKFCNLEEAMRDRLILGLEDLNLQKRLLTKSGITLQAALDEARANKSSNKSAAALKKQSSSRQSREATVHHKSTEPEESAEEIHCTHSERSVGISKVGERHFWCAGCGKNHPRLACKFKDATCQRCEWKGHIARACRSTQPVFLHQKQPVFPS